MNKLHDLNYNEPLVFYVNGKQVNLNFYIKNWNAKNSDGVPTFLYQNKRNLILVLEFYTIFLYEFKTNFY